METRLNKYITDEMEQEFEEEYGELIEELNILGSTLCAL